MCCTSIVARVLHPQDSTQQQRQRSRPTIQTPVCPWWARRRSRPPRNVTPTAPASVSRTATGDGSQPSHFSVWDNLRRATFPTTWISTTPAVPRALLLKFASCPRRCPTVAAPLRLWCAQPRVGRTSRCCFFRLLLAATRTPPTANQAH